MKDAKSTSSKLSPALLICVLMVVILAGLTWKCFLPDYVFFANDGPLGIQAADFLKAPQSFLGQWFDLWSMGWSAGASFVDFTSLLRWVLGPVRFSAFYFPIAQFVLGYGAFFFFRRSGMGARASILGGLAACLTTNFFSNGAWGAFPAVFAFGMDFFALGALAKKDDRLPFWVSPALAGLAVGFNVMEAADIGGLFSLLVAAYVLYRSLINSNDELTPVKRVVGLCCINFSLLALLTVGFVKHLSPVVLLLLVLAGGVVNWALLSRQTIANRLGLGVIYTWFVSTFAIFMAAYAVVGFLGTSVTGISGTQQDLQTKAMKWDFATQWSLPKRETLSLIIPGLFGDRVDFGDDKAYWGGMGRDAQWDRFYHEKLRPGDSVSLAMPGTSGVTRLQINNNGDLALPSTAPIKAAGKTRAELQTEISSTPLKGATIQYVIGNAFLRHTGRGFYFGLLVVILGLWTALQSFRKQESVFSLPERKMIWFWSVVAVISLLGAHGKFSPLESFYYWIYTIMPYSSTVRNPEKFLHVMNLAVIILFGYGVQGLDRRYLEGVFYNAPLGARLKNWWAKAAAFDKRWVIGSVMAIIFAFVGWIAYAAARPAVEKYLTTVEFGPETAHAVAGYSLQQVAWFVVFLVLYCGVLLLIFAGTFSGRRAKWGGILLGVLLVADLAHADLPYLVFWNYKQKYEVGELNPICTLLADKPYEHRVKELPVPDEYGWFGQLYGIEWLQQIFPYYNIQSLDLAQLPRKPVDMDAFDRAQYFPGTPALTREWQLTNTRYLVGPAINPDEINQQLDPALKRFRMLSVFRLAGKPGIESPRTLTDVTAAPLQGGDPALSDNRIPKYALYEFTGALPRVKLYSNWETNSAAALSSFSTKGLDPNQLEVLQSIGTNDFLTLQKLVSPSFDPNSAVLLSNPIAGSATSSASNQAAGDVDFTSYAPTDIKLKANAAVPSVLLLNDRYDPGWEVFVDGKSAELLRCNYIMRGVFLQPGQHEVEFRFRLPVKLLYVNIAAIVVGLGLLGYAIAGTRKPSETDEDPAKPNPEKTEKLNASR